MNGHLANVPIASIELTPQPRTHFEDDGLRALAESIERNGLQHPPTGYEVGGRIRIISGERRVRAHALLERAGVAMYLVTPPADDAELLTLQLVCNLERQDLHPIDRANGIRSLIEHAAITADAAAKLLGLSPATVSRSLGLLRLPEQLQVHVASGAIPPDIGYRLSGIADPAEQARLAEEVMGDRLTREALTRKFSRVRRAKDTKNGTRVTAQLGAGRSVTFTGGDLSLDTVTEWLEQLLAKAKKAKSQGLSLQTFARALKDQSKA